MLLIWKRRAMARRIITRCFKSYDVNAEMVALLKFKGAKRKIELPQPSTAQQKRKKEVGNIDSDLNERG